MDWLTAAIGIGVNVIVLAVGGGIAVGSLRSDIRSLGEDITDIKSDMKQLRSDSISERECRELRHACESARRK